MTTTSSRSNSTELASGSFIGDTDLYGNLEVKWEIPNPSTCLSVRFNPSGKVYGVALADGTANVYLTATDRLIYSVNRKKNTQKRHHYSATSLRFRPWGIENLNENSLILVTLTNGKVKTFHFPSGECVHTIREGEREIITSDYSPRGDTFATAGDDGRLIIYDDETRVQLVSYEPPFYERKEFRRIYSIVYHPQATDELITGGWDGIVRYYDIRIPHMIKQFHGPYVCGEGLSFHPSGREICSASWRRPDAIQLWDYGTGSLIKTVPVGDTSAAGGAESVTSGASARGGGKRMSIRPRTSTTSLPPIASGSKFQAQRKSSHYGRDTAMRLKLPRMLYCCRYFINGDLIAFCGSDRNSMAVVNKHTNEIVVAISNLSHSPYCLDTYRNKVALAAGNHVSLNKVDRNFIAKFL